MLLSKSCEYGLRATLYLAGRAPGELTPIRSVSEALHLPYHFLAKIAQTLTSARILTSVRGPHGGVALARPAGEITLEEIVIAIDGPHIFTECVLGLPGCGTRRACPLHAAWAPARDLVQKMFRHASLEDTAHRIAEGNFRLADLTRGHAPGEESDGSDGTVRSVGLS
jgi:Rrf2 family transcriptional regulator, iron-sulfur cluster assembly transcription factor